MSVDNVSVSSMGESLDEFFNELGTREEVFGAAVKEVFAWQVANALKEKALTKVEVAARMKTSRTQLKRVLDPANTSVSLESLASMAHAIGKKLKVELVDA